RGADVSNCKIYGLSAWDLLVDKNTKQDQLHVTYQPQGTGTKREEVVVRQSRSGGLHLLDAQQPQHLTRLRGDRPSMGPFARAIRKAHGAPQLSAEGAHEPAVR